MTRVGQAGRGDQQQEVFYSGNTAFISLCNSEYCFEGVKLQWREEEMVAGYTGKMLLCRRLPAVS